MLSFIKQVILISTLTTVVGCSSLYGDQGIIRNRDTEYLKAQTIAPINIPEGYSGSSLQENYPVPIKHYTEEQKRISLIPPELNTPGQ